MTMTGEWCPQEAGSVGTGTAQEETMPYTSLFPWEKDSHANKDSQTDHFVSCFQICQAWALADASPQYPTV